VGLGSEMDIYEKILFVRISMEQQRKQLKGRGSLWGHLRCKYCTSAGKDGPE